MFRLGSVPAPSILQRGKHGEKAKAPVKESQAQTEKQEGGAVCRSDRSGSGGGSDLAKLRAGRRRGKPEFAGGPRGVS